MKKILNHSKRILAVMLSCFLVFGLFVPVYAESSDSSDEDTESIDLNVGETVEKTIYFYINPNLSFVSSNPSVADASQTGSSITVSNRVYYGAVITITASSVGDTTIEVYNYSTKVQTYNVSVTPKQIDEEVHVGQSKEYDFITKDDDDFAVDNENIQSSLSKTIVTETVNDLSNTYVKNHLILTFPAVGTFDFTIKGAKTGTLYEGHVTVSDHNWDEGVIIQDPTCTDDGIKRYTCTGCGATKDEAIPSFGSHSWDEGTIIQAPTCTEEGIRRYTCTRCGETKDEAIPSFGGHNWDVGTIIQNPTCTEEGIRRYTCIRCGETKDELVPPTGHNMVKTEAKAPTKLEDGNIEYWTCLNDGKTYIDEEGTVEISKEAVVLPMTGDLHPFVDVNDETPHDKDIVWMYNSEVSTGWAEAAGTRTYRPMNAVVRQDMAAFLRREAKNLGVEDAETWKPGEDDWNTFTDVNKDTPHAEDILWLAHAGISTGWTEADGTRTYRGMDTVKRQDMAAFLHRLANLAGIKRTGEMTFTDVNDSTPHAQDIYWLGGTGISTGYTDGTYQGMWPVYRQDMAAFIHRLDNLK